MPRHPLDDEVKSPKCFSFFFFSEKNHGAIRMTVVMISSLWTLAVKGEIKRNASATTSPHWPKGWGGKKRKNKQQEKKK
jgi:hypothetical protein